MESPPHPPGEFIIRREARRIDTDKAGQSPAGEPHRPHVGLGKRLLTVLRAYPDHQ
jgi:lipoprotein-anchoring transpeptidase ErfK/SrfK